MTIERRIDRGAPALEERIDARTGVLTVRYAPTWIGVREYQREDGSISRELHRPEQVCSPGFCAQLARLPIPIGHPEDEHGPVWLHVDPRAPGPSGYSVREPRDFAVGWTGESAEMRPCAEWPEIQIPTVTATFTDQRGIALLRAGVLESSLGYDVFVDRTPGVWVAPDGSEHPYDAEHVLDPADPRLAGVPEAERRLLGPNHLAALPYGRGGAQSAVRWDAAPRPRIGVRRDGGPVMPGIQGIPAGWRGWLEQPQAWQTGAREFAGLAQADPTTPAIGAPLQQWADPVEGWLGWSEAGESIAFWLANPEGWALVWTSRDPDGAVVGEPAIYKGIAGAVPVRDRAETPRKIAVVTRTSLRIPAEIRRDGMASIEMPDDPAAVASLEALLGSLASAVSEYKSKLAAAEGAAAEGAAKMGEMEIELEDLRPMADLGKRLDADMSAGQVKALGLEPAGKSGPEIREAAVVALRPEAVSRYPQGSKERAVAVDAAFAVLVAAKTPAAPQAPRAGERPLPLADREPAPRTPVTPAARGRFSEEA